MLPFRIEATTVADLIALISNKVPEDGTLDFKSELPGTDSSAKHEFSADVCAFANGHGGDIVFGMREDVEGNAGSITGIDTNPDEQVLRLQDIARSGIEPRVPNLAVFAVNLGENKYAFIVRIPMSHAGPHRVKSNRHYFLREGRQKKELDMDQIFRLYERRQDLTSKIREFRANRCRAIMEESAASGDAFGAIGVFHIYPLSAYSPTEQVNFLQYETTRILPLVSDLQWTRRLNIDGIIQRGHNSSPRGAARLLSYTHLFRTGAIESVYQFSNNSDGHHTIIPSTRYEVDLAKFLDAVKTEYQVLQVEAPFVLMYRC